MSNKKELAEMLAAAILGAVTGTALGIISGFGWVGVPLWACLGAVVGFVSYQPRVILGVTNRMFKKQLLSGKEGWVSKLLSGCDFFLKECAPITWLFLIIFLVVLSYGAFYRFFFPEGVWMANLVKLFLLITIFLCGSFSVFTEVFGYPAKVKKESPYFLFSKVFAYRLGVHQPEGSKEVSWVEKGTHCSLSGLIETIKMTRALFWALFFAPFAFSLILLDLFLSIFTACASTHRLAAMFGSGGGVIAGLSLHLLGQSPVLALNASIVTAVALSLGALGVRVCSFKFAPYVASLA